MSETKQNPEMQPPPQPMEIYPTLESTASARVPHTPQIALLPKPLPPQQSMSMTLNPKPTTKSKAPMTRANWVNTLWADISGQLRRWAVISSDLFDGLLLRKDTKTGSLILREFVSLPYSALSSDHFHRDADVICPAQDTRSTGR